MGIKLIIQNLMVYTEKNNKYFYTDFEDGVNIIYGKNTSGKSTVFQLILYAFGINENNEYLKEIIDEEILVRIDCQITNDEYLENVIFIRENEILYVKRGDSPAIRFNGINANNSFEHIRLKMYMHQLFGFSLILENKDGFKLAPIEAMFMPYYISQSVGWVYLRKTFSSFDFYKNFKNDYLDYFLGIESFVNREEKQKLEQQLKNKEREINFFMNLQVNNRELLVTKLIDENFTEVSSSYIDSHSDNQRTMVKKEEELISKCNNLSYYQERYSLLRKISREHKKQNPINGVCPTCEQSLGFSIKASYKYFQEENDTLKEVEFYKTKIKKISSEINSLRRDIDKLKEIKLKDYDVLMKYKTQNISFDSWMNNKANTQLINNLNSEIAELKIEKVDILNKLKDYKTEEEVEEFRRIKSNEFKKIFLGYLDELGVKSLKGERYKSLYKISAFPSQGVELHKTVLAYNFAFNDLIKSSKQIHRFPFMLDAIFKEDIEQSNKEIIVDFISKNRPNDTQVILSVAEMKEHEHNIYNYNEDFFNKKAKLICIGEGMRERAFLSEYDGGIEKIIDETLNFMT